MSRQAKSVELSVWPPVPIDGHRGGSASKLGPADGGEHENRPPRDHLELPVWPAMTGAGEDGGGGSNHRPDPAKANKPGTDEASNPHDGSTHVYQAHGGHHISPHRFLTPAEWSVVANGIGGVGDDEKQQKISPTSVLWPPWGMPRGLYRDIVTCKAKFFVFHAISILHWTLMISQLLIGAVVTSLGAMATKKGKGTAITILGAINTVIAGLLALMHNSGLPDRYRYDMVQFEELEDHIKEILDSAIALANQTTDQILAGCFDLFREAKATVAANMPVNYNSRRSLQGASQQMRNMSLTPPLADLATSATARK